MYPSWSSFILIPPQKTWSERFHMFIIQLWGLVPVLSTSIFWFFMPYLLLQPHTPFWAVEVEQFTPARGLLYPLRSHFRIPLSCGWLGQFTVILLFSIQYAHISLSQNLNHIILQNHHSNLTSRGTFNIWYTLGGLCFATWNKVTDGLLLTEEVLHRHRSPSVWK